MKAFYLFLVVFIHVCCVDQTQKKIELLEKRLENTPILSASFDSLWQDVQKLSSRQQIIILLRISYRDERKIDGMLKQENILLKGIPLASKKEKKKILLRSLEIYKKLAEQKEYNAITKGLQLCKDLETDFSLSQEEEWEIKKIKAILLGRKGLHEQYLPIWFELLAEHRAAKKSKLIIEDLFTIASQLTILGDQEKGVTLYKEAYQLAIDNHYTEELGIQCLIRLIYLSYGTKEYTEVVNYSNKIGVDSLALFMPSVYSILSTCYLELQKCDSARFYLTKMDQTLKTGNGMILNCRIADTYIAENKIDSAHIFLDKATMQFQNQAELLQKKTIKASLPFCFLSTNSSLATLYQQNGNYVQADKLFKSVEPLMKKATKEFYRLEIQANALNRYSFYCRATKQYEKTVDLLMRRDSIQQIINKANKERENKNFIDRLQIRDLMHKIDMQEVSLTNSHRMFIIASTCAVLFFFLICAIAYIYYQRKKRLTVIINQEKEAKQLELSATSENKKSFSAEEKLFRKAQKKVTTEKLFLNKDIKLKSLAEILGTNHSYLSSCINTCSGKNYNQWINDFRIDYLLEQIHSGKKLSDLIQEAGFASTDAFYRSFKRKTNLTPSEYMKQHHLTKDS